MNHNRTYFTRKGDSNFPLPSSSEPYVYLKSLMNNPGITQRIGMLAQTKLKTYSDTLASHGMENSLEFLKNAAAIQRSHELDFINTKVKELQSLGLLGREEKEIIESLQEMQKENFNYAHFIKGLNIVINNVQKYESRIKGFRDKKTINTPQLNMVTNFKTMINNFSEQRHAFYLSQEEVIRQATMRFLQREAGAHFVTACGTGGIANIAAASALISQQLAQYIYDNGLMEYKARTKGGTNYFKTEQEFLLQINEIEKHFDDFARTTNIESLYGNHNLLSDIQELYGIKVEANTLDIKNGISKDAVKQLKSVQSQLRNDKLLTENQRELMSKISVSFREANFQLSFENELVSALAPAFSSHAAVGHRNRATDMLLGWLHVNISADLSTQADPVQQTLTNIQSLLAKTNMQESGNKIADIYMDELTKLDQTLTGLGEAFIFHESTKNYNSLEQGRWPGKLGNGFSGRNMNMFNYISQINSFAADIGLDMKQLEFIAYNLSEDALGSDSNFGKIKASVSNIFSIFAGIMMFDDFLVIGKEVLDGMQFSNVHNIHLYRLQDTYMPSSMFLDATYKAMKQMQDELLEGNAFEVSITAPPINYYGENWTVPFEDRWELVREKAKKQNKIKIQFAGNFLSLMSQLF